MGPYPEPAIFAVEGQVADVGLAALADPPGVSTGLQLMLRGGMDE